MDIDGRWPLHLSPGQQKAGGHERRPPAFG